MTRKPSTSVVATWRRVRFRARFTADYLIDGCNHLELIVLAPKGAALPITETGYLSHFDTEARVADATATLAFFIAWLDREADTKRWRTHELKRAQLDLFS
jgi:hypothetical protein